MRKLLIISFIKGILCVAQHFQVPPNGFLHMGFNETQISSVRIASDEEDFNLTEGDYETTDIVGAVSPKYFLMTTKSKEIINLKPRKKIDHKTYKNISIGKKNYPGHQTNITKMGKVARKKYNRPRPINSTNSNNVSLSNEISKMKYSPVNQILRKDTEGILNRTHNGHSFNSNLTNPNISQRYGTSSRSNHNHQSKKMLNTLPNKDNNRNRLHPKMMSLEGNKMKGKISQNSTKQMLTTLPNKNHKGHKVDSKIKHLEKNSNKRNKIDKVLKNSTKHVENSPPNRYNMMNSKVTPKNRNKIKKKLSANSTNKYPLNIFDVGTSKGNISSRINSSVKASKNVSNFDQSKKRTQYALRNNYTGVSKDLSRLHNLNNTSISKQHLIPPKNNTKIFKYSKKLVEDTPRKKFLMNKTDMNQTKPRIDSITKRTTTMANFSKRTSAEMSFSTTTSSRSSTNETKLLDFEKSISAISNRTHFPKNDTLLSFNSSKMFEPILSKQKLAFETSSKSYIMDLEDKMLSTNIQYDYNLMPQNKRIVQKKLTSLNIETPNTTFFNGTPKTIAYIPSSVLEFNMKGNMHENSKNSRTTKERINRFRSPSTSELFDTKFSNSSLNFGSPRYSNKFARSNRHPVVKQIHPNAFKPGNFYEKKKRYNFLDIPKSDTYEKIPENTNIQSSSILAPRKLLYKILENDAITNMNEFDSNSIPPSSLSKKDKFHENLELNDKNNFLKQHFQKSSNENISELYDFGNKLNPPNNLDSFTEPNNDSETLNSKYFEEFDWNYNTTFSSIELKTKQPKVCNIILNNSSMPLITVENHTYHLINTIKSNFISAYQFCKTYGLELLSIETKEEENSIVNFLREYNVTEVWTSGTDLADEGNFMWLSTGKFFNYTNWAENQPDNYGFIEDCVQIILQPQNSSSYKWEDTICDNVSYFICQNSNCTEFCV